MILLLCITTFTLATVAGVVGLAARTGPRQVAVAPNWWIPLFLKAAALAAVGVGVGLVSFQYLLWRETDADNRRLLNGAVVLGQQRYSNHTSYDLDPIRSRGWSRLNRYDLKLVWEPIALFAAVGGLISRGLAVVIARSAIGARKKQLGFPVLEVSSPSDTR